MAPRGSVCEGSGSCGNVSARVLRGGTMTGTQGGLRSSTLEDGVGYAQG